MLAKAILGQLRRLRHRCRDAALMLTLWLAAFTSGLAPAEAEAGSAESVTRVVDIGDGVTLHYAEQGSGVPVVFVHGSLSDYSYWDPQLSAFSGRYRAIAYSRRYNPPNQNPAITGYSAVTDSDDLAAFVTGSGWAGFMLLAIPTARWPRCFSRRDTRTSCAQSCWPSHRRLRCYNTFRTSKPSRATRCSPTSRKGWLSRCRGGSPREMRTAASRYSSTMYSTTRAPGQGCRKRIARPPSGLRANGT
jgi:hypothetical protein